MTLCKHIPYQAPGLLDFRDSYFFRNARNGGEPGLRVFREIFTSVFDQYISHEITSRALGAADNFHLCQAWVYGL